MTLETKVNCQNCREEKHDNCERPDSCKCAYYEHSNNLLIGVRVSKNMDSTPSDLFREFFTQFKIDNEYKYVKLIDVSIIQSKIIEIDYNDFTDEMKNIFENKSEQTIHEIIYRAIIEIFQVRYGPGERINVEHEDILKFKIINSKFNKIFSKPNYFTDEMKKQINTHWEVIKENKNKKKDNLHKKKLMKLRNLRVRN